MKVEIQPFGLGLAGTVGNTLRVDLPGPWAWLLEAAKGAAFPADPLGCVLFESGLVAPFGHGEMKLPEYPLGAEGPWVPFGPLGLQAAPLVACDGPTAAWQHALRGSAATADFVLLLRPPVTFFAA